MFKQNSGIIIACDVSSLSDLRLLLEISADQETVVGYKVGFTLVLRFGLKEVVSFIRSLSQLPIIYDHQKGGTDIPSMGVPFAAACWECGVQGVILFPQAGPHTLATWTNELLAKGLTPIIGGMMTHSSYLASDNGFIIDSAPFQIYSLSFKHGVSHFVVPGNNPNLIREYANLFISSNRPISFLMPGIGTQGGDLAQAFMAAADCRPYAIIGSAIYQADDPRVALVEYSRNVAALACFIEGEK